MTLLHVEGFDWCPALAGDFPTDGPVRLTAAFPTTAGVWTFANTNSRWPSGQALTFGTNGGGSDFASCPSVLFNLAGAWAATHHVIAGFAIQPHLSDKTVLCSFVNTNGEQICSVGISSIGYLSCYGGSGTDFVNPLKLAEDLSHPLANDQWYAIEVEAYCNVANGTGAVLKVWVNNVLVLNYAGTFVTAGNITSYSASDFALGAGAGVGTNNTFAFGGPADYEDVFIIVADSTAPSARLGTDPRVDPIYPTSEDSLSGYTRTGGTGASDAIGSGSCDGDTSYYRGLTTNDEGRFDSTDSLSGVPTTVHGVGLTHITRKTGAGSRGVSPILNDNSTDYAGTEAALTTGYGRYQSIWTVRPSNSAAWGKTTVEAAKIGVKITS